MSWSVLRSVTKWLVWLGILGLPLLVSAQMPWDAPITAVSSSVVGKLVPLLLPVAFVIFGLAWMFGMHISGWIMGIVIGGVIAANSAWFAGWLGGGGR